jgi:hypothetical protein
LRFEDEIFGQDYYCEAAEGIVDIYLHIYNNPDSCGNDEPDYSKMTAAERKKAKGIARKKKKAVEKKEAVQREKESENGGAKKTPNKNGKPSFVDEDPLGLELVKKDPLEEAHKYTSTLARYAPKRLKTWLLQYDIAVRRSKPLMALQALYRAQSLASDNSELFTRIVDFAQRVDKFQNLSDTVKTVVAETFPSLMNDMALTDFVKAAADKIRNDPITPLPLRTAVAQALVDLAICSAAEASDLISHGGITSKGVDTRTVVEAHDMLQSFGDDASVARTTWLDAIKNRFPLIEVDSLS